MNKYILLYLKGLLMGSADIVPGVSGGTVAFVVGIYEELLDSIRSVNVTAFKILFSQGIGAFWRHVNGTFLIVLIAGIATSFALLSHLIVWLMNSQGVLFWAFVFGLIVASALHVGKMIEQYNSLTIMAFIAGFALSLLITLIKPAHIEPNYVIIFFAGAIAICAMILPGISGSFMLLLMGLYGYMMQALKSFDLPTIIAFVAGCVTGILLFSHVVSWLFKHYHQATLAFLTGMLFASLNAIWPWHISAGLGQDNLLPAQYTLMTGQPAHVLFSLVLMALGMVLVLCLERLDRSKS